MWSERHSKKLQKHAESYEAAIVLGCESAVETVRDAVMPTTCKVIEGMAREGIMNAKIKFSFPCNIAFEDCKTIPFQQEKNEADA